LLVISQILLLANITAYSKIKTTSHKLIPFAKILKLFYRGEPLLIFRNDNPVTPKTNITKVEGSGTGIVDSAIPAASNST
jgi:hypothetical protein